MFSCTSFLPDTLLGKRTWLKEDRMSLLVPTFMNRLSDPTVKTVMLSGCGGGFDFVHAMTLYPELMRLGKNVVIGSNSFGNPNRIGGKASTTIS